LLPEQLDRQNNQANNKKKKTDPVYTMHITDPFAVRAVSILFADKQVFCQLFEDSHKNAAYCKSKQLKSPES
jgi:hypothetical protein